MTLDPTTIAVGVALLLAAFVKGTTGFGFPLIATPMVALLLDIRTAITILILPNILMDAAQIFRGSFPSAIIRRFGWLLFLTIFGVFLGTKVLVMLPLWALNLSLGVMILAFVVSNFFRFEPAIPPRLERISSPGVGFAVGFLNGMTNAAGPVLASYLYSLKLPKTEFVRSISTIFMITKISQLAAVSTWNLFNFETLRLSAGVTVFVMLGFYFGLKTQDRVNQKTFNRALLIILFAIGVMLVARGLR
jgi:uncharacterized membrane protein YfcA